MKEKYIKKSFVLMISAILIFGILTSKDLHKLESKKKSEGFGFINKNGDLVIGPKAFFVEDFKDGLAYGFDSKKKFYINKTGNIEFENDLLVRKMGFSEGLTIIRDSSSNNQGYINKEGRIIIKPTFYMAKNFSEGLAAVYFHNKGWGFINKKGETVIQPKNYYNVYDFSEGFSAVKTKEEWVYKKQWVHKGIKYKEFPLKTQKWGFINRKGEMTIPDKFDSVRNFSEGLALINIGGWISIGGIEEFVGGKYGFINKKGEIVIEPNFVWAKSFSCGLAAVYVNNRGVGFINKKGKIAISCIYDDAAPFSEGLAAVMIKGKWGYINKEGKILIEPKFYCNSQSYFSEGLAAVKFNGKWGYIDKEGNWAVKPQFLKANAFSDGLARVKVAADSSRKIKGDIN